MNHVMQQLSMCCDDSCVASLRHQLTWHSLDSFVCSCMCPQHVAHVLPSCGKLDCFGRREGSIDPATEAHHPWFIKCGPQLHFRPKVPGQAGVTISM